MKVLSLSVYVDELAGRTHNESFCAGQVLEDSHEIHSIEIEETLLF